MVNGVSFVGRLLFLIVILVMLVRLLGCRI